ncbi:MAG: hypothetical protein FJ398_22855 [Verrucomicrobia bacterium]|nr:hypothetical protein [Verrucomicrobiota bacterium]
MTANWPCAWRTRSGKFRVWSCSTPRRTRLIYPPEQFFDTANHLTAEGAATRTTRLIDSLRRFATEREQTGIPRTGLN